MVKIRKIGGKPTAAQRRVYVTFSDNEKEYKFADEAGAKKWLKAAGWKFMASRFVFVHRERQVFYGKSSAAYDKGQYAQATVPVFD